MNLQTQNLKSMAFVFVHICSLWPVSSIHMQGKPVKREQTSLNLAEQHHYLLLQKHGPAQEMQIQQPHTSVIEFF